MVLGKSQHSTGQAADFYLPKKINMFGLLEYVYSLPFDQLILEKPPSGWVHCSFGGSGRRTLLVWTGGANYPSYTLQQIKQKWYS